jgi:RecB family exonuclease
MPDPRLGLPDPGGLILGSVVHDVLQHVVEEAVGADLKRLEDVAGEDGQTVPWPTEDRVKSMALEAAERVAARNGLVASGVAPLLAAQALPVIEVARELEWTTGVAQGVVAAEVKGEVAVGESATVRFRADRVDRDGDSVVMVDYKTGKPLSDAKKPDTRASHLLREVKKGQSLQGVAYALAVPEPLRGEGRYVALRPDIGDTPEEARTTVAAADNDELVAAFCRSVETVVAGWRAGGLVPRVEEPGKSSDKAPKACGHCPVAQACLRTDPGFRRRLVEWMSTDQSQAAEPERSAWNLWWIGIDKPGNGGDR